MTDTQLTTNFWLSEFLDEDTPPPEDPIILANIQCMAERLQVLRDIFNARITINSGYRTKEKNDAIPGAARNSQHLLGRAADIVVEGYEPSKVRKILKNWSGGLGKYNTFTHIDLRREQHRW